MAHECLFVLLTASLLDALLGDPRYPLHPVRLIGGASRRVEFVLRRLRLSGILGGAALVIAVMSIFLGGYAGARFGLYAAHHWLGLNFDVFVTYSCITLKDLLDHARPIAGALERDDLSTARERVQKIVGRDAQELNASGVAGAAVESVAESFVDGVLSPLFWFAMGALVSHVAGFSASGGAVTGILAQRTVNTLDSLVGYRNERYIRFGRVAARLDDTMNLIPSRLAGLFLFISAAVCGLHPFRGLRVYRRDRLKHTSPNAGHPQSFVAGALEVRLGGPTVYPHGIVEKPWIGNGSNAVTAEHVRNCNRLILCAGWISIGACLLVLSTLLPSQHEHSRPSPARAAVFETAATI